MKKRRILLTCFVILLLLAAAAPFLSAQEEEEPEPEQKFGITYFSPGSLYFYLMGSFNRFAPPYDYWELGMESSDAFAPVFGVGYRLINLWHRIIINLEADYAPARYDFALIQDQKITTLTLLVDFEWHLKRSRLALTFGIGVGFFRLYDLGYYNVLDEYVYLGSETVTTPTMKFGIKVPISRKLLLRGEFRLCGETTGGYYDYYYDEYYGGEWDYLASALCLGLELHL